MVQEIVNTVKVSEYGKSTEEIAALPVRLVEGSQAQVEELQKIRKVIHAPWFKKRLSPDEQVMAYRQYNLTRDLVNVLDERIELFRVDNPKPGK